MTTSTITGCAPTWTAQHPLINALLRDLDGNAMRLHYCQTIARMHGELSSQYAQAAEWFADAMRKERAP